MNADEHRSVFICVHLWLISSASSATNARTKRAVSSGPPRARLLHPRARSAPGRYLGSIAFVLQIDRLSGLRGDRIDKSRKGGQEELERHCCGSGDPIGVPSSFTATRRRRTVGVVESVVE